MLYNIILYCETEGVDRKRISSSTSHSHLKGVYIYPFFCSRWLVPLNLRYWASSLFTWGSSSVCTTLLVRLEWSRLIWFSWTYSNIHLVRGEKTVGRKWKQIWPWKYCLDLQWMFNMPLDILCINALHHTLNLYKPMQQIGFLYLQGNQLRSLQETLWIK